MSRTYRRTEMPIDCDCGAPPFDSDGSASIEYARRKGEPLWRDCDCCHTKYDYYTKHNLKRDRKSHSKPDKGFKKTLERGRKSKIRNAMKKAWADQDFDKYDCLPKFKKEDVWLWN